MEVLALMGLLVLVLLVLILMTMLWPESFDPTLSHKP